MSAFQVQVLKLLLTVILGIKYSENQSDFSFNHLSLFYAILENTLKDANK